MSPPLEHDYLADSPSITAGKPSRNDQNAPLNLKETELRLGLPGSQSPERSKPNLGVSIFGKELKNAVSGAKRGFSDAIDGNWVIFSNPEGDSVKAPALFSPRGGSGAKGALDNNGDCDGLKKEDVQEENTQLVEHAGAPASKAQVVGWPPIRSFRKNSMAKKNMDETEAKSGPGRIYVKVSLDGAPYLRKIDLNNYSNYALLSTALEKMFSCFTIGQCGSGGLSDNCLKDIIDGSEFVLTYEDKDGDWMLVGDVPWEMFTNSCSRLRIMKSSEAIGLAPRAIEKSKN